MLDFCAEKGVASDVEVIRIDEINQAYERMLKNDVRYRFVIDIASLRTRRGLSALRRYFSAHVSTDFCADVPQRAFICA